MPNVVIAISNLHSFTQGILDVAAVSGRAIGEEGLNQGRLIAAELIQRTPPLSNKNVQKGKGLSRLGQVEQPPGDLENLTAYAVGKRRVERDIRKTTKGVKGARASIKAGGKRLNVWVYNPVEASDGWGVKQRCENKPAVRMFSTTEGAYGAEQKDWQPSVNVSEFTAYHNKQRDSKGHVSLAKQVIRAVGRWRWMETLVTKEQELLTLIARKQKAVGQGKGGWVAMLVACKGKASTSGWYGRHVKSGSCHVEVSHDSFLIEAENHSEWAGGGSDPEKVVERAIEWREEMMEQSVQKFIEDSWGKIK